MKSKKRWGSEPHDDSRGKQENHAFVFIHMTLRMTVLRNWTVLISMTQGNLKHFDFKFFVIFIWIFKRRKQLCWVVQIAMNKPGDVNPKYDLASNWLWALGHTNYCWGLIFLMYKIKTLAHYTNNIFLLCIFDALISWGLTNLEGIRVLGLANS